MSNLFDLSGRTALVTGSSQGIGLSLARGLADAGAAVILNGRDRAKLEAAAAEIPGSRILAFDVTEHETVRAAIDDFEATVGPIDIAVNNAGVQHRTPLEDFPAADFERLLHANISSVFHVGQAVARHMIARGAGKIVNIASVNVQMARYKGMASDWARHGLNCNAIAPGYMRTPLNEPLWSDDSFNSWLEQRTPARRWGEPEELIGACVFLASEASTFVNGHILYVDGGITASL
jgi:gluconate 5-dehydrogenase